MSPSAHHLTTSSPLADQTPCSLASTQTTGRSRASPTHRLQCFPTPRVPSYPLTAPRRSNQRLHLPHSNFAQEGGRWRCRIDVLEDRQQHRHRRSCEGWEVEGSGEGVVGIFGNRQGYHALLLSLSRFEQREGRPEKVRARRVSGEFSSSPPLLFLRLSLTADFLLFLGTLKDNSRPLL